MASTQKDILDAVETVITALSLTECEAVEVRTAPTDGGIYFPGVSIHAIGESEFPGTNERDDPGYQIQVTMVLNSNNDQDEGDILGQWRQNIRKAFAHQKISTVSTSCTCLVNMGKMYENVKGEYDVSTLVIIAISREARV